MLKRCLTESEINSILDFIQPQIGIPEETAASIVNINKGRLRGQLTKQVLYPQDIPELKRQIEKYYFTSIIQPGECVGVIAAQSIGEKQTQSTLSAFHHTGANITMVTSGVGRFQELINISKNPKATSCTIYFKNNYNSIQDLRDIIGNTFVEITFETIAEDIQISMDKQPERWYESFKVLYNTEIPYQHCISFKLKKELLFEYKLSLFEISQIIENEYSDMICVFSPDSFSQIDIFIDTSTINLPEGRMLFIDQENALQIYLEEVVLPILEKMKLCGIPNISGIFYSQIQGREENLEWVISTNGSNFPLILAHPEVDNTRTITNNIREIYNTLGIEATREFLIREFMDIMSGINKCHVKILVERMTYSGILESVSRYSMRSDDSGAFCKASFEETVENFTKAGMHGEEESTMGVSASIICGKQANIGTGMMDLKIDVEKLMRIKEEDEKEETDQKEYK